jgi:hypothetical protein
MCCGQKRTDLRNSQTQRTMPSVPLYGASNSPAQAVRTQPRTPPLMRTVSPVNTQSRSVQPQALTATSMQHSFISVRYQENSPVRVRGSVSGMFYEFSGSNPVQQVDARDASSLLSTRFFRRA